MTAYYNEIGPYAASWLRNLIAAGHIAPGDVDERSIEDVRPDELRGYTQCHFFAGIGVWSYALRNAGWPDSRPVWTGSCPCQPFSAAGKGGGFADERHLWPAFHHLIRECGPDVVFGEQVASKDGLAWLDLVQADLEGSAYASGAVDLCAAGVGAPHIRQRSWWFAQRVADCCSRLEGEDTRALGYECSTVKRDCRNGGLDHHHHHHHHQGLEGQWNRHNSALGHGARATRSASEAGQSDGLADDDRLGCGAEAGRSIHDAEHHAQPRSGLVEGQPGPTNGLWRDADWLFCRDGKWRPVEPGTFPLAHGAASRVGRLRAYGNAIVAQAAEEFIRAYLDVERDRHLRLTAMSEMTVDVGFNEGIFA